MASVIRAINHDKLTKKGEWLDVGAGKAEIGDGRWRPNDPEIVERMRDLNAHQATVDSKLARDDHDVVRFDNGDPDFAPFMFRAKTKIKGPKDANGKPTEVEVTGDSRIVIGEASFYPPRFYEMAREVVSPARLKEIEATKRKEVEGYDKLEAKTDPMAERMRILEALTPEQRVQIAGRLTKQEMDSMRDAHFSIADEALAKRMGWMKGKTPDVERVEQLRMGRDSTKPKVAYPPDGEMGYPPLTYNVDGREVVAGGFTWHHVENSSELILVPRFLHGMIPHKGGISTRGKTH